LKNTQVPVLLLIIFEVSFSPSLFAEQELAFRLLPGAAIPLGRPNISAGFGAGGSFDWTMFPFAGLTIGGGYAGLPVKDGTMLTLLEGKAGPLGQYRITDRFTVRGEGSIGFNRKTWGEYTDSGLLLGGMLSAIFHISPYLQVLGYGAYTHYAYTAGPPMQTFMVGAGISLNLSEILGRKTRVSGVKTLQHMIFPVSYAWYEENPVAMVTVTNGEPNAITAVEVSLFLEQYMNEPTLGAVIPLLSSGESVEVPVTAFFNGSMLDLTENIDANARFIIDYRSLGSLKSAEIPVRIPIYHRNAMSWDDDRRAASFVSARDPTAALFARLTAVAVEDRMKPDLSRNIQYALGLFEALQVYGINYVIDPASSYVEMSGDAMSLDSLNYPYQTLFFRGGDCDDLSILFCSLLEVLKIDTAFITVPGHIYMAFDSGMTAEEARTRFSVPGIDPARDFIYEGGRVWMPLEITVPQAGFFQAWRIGAREWKSAAAEAKLYPLKDAWILYPPVSVPGAGRRRPTMPAESALTAAFDSSLSTFINRTGKR
jgi:hypothetical protein